MMITSVCAISLFAQAVNLVVTAFLTYDAIGVIVFLLIVEIVPSIFLLNLYRISSDFTKKMKSKTRTKRMKRGGRRAQETTETEVKLKRKSSQRETIDSVMEVGEINATNDKVNSTNDDNSSRT